MLSAARGARCGALTSLLLSALFSHLGIAAGSELRVIDGDTVQLSSVTYRLHGIDAPEAGQKCIEKDGGQWPCGKVAIKRMQELVSVGNVVCDARGTDGYGRTIAVCRTESIDLGATMISEGLAWAFRKYSLDYVGEETRAHREGLGVWRAESETPWDYRAHKWDVAKQDAPEGCPIKGNISKQGKIYHAPWSPWYLKTNVTVANGERWFCSESDAVAAGWRAPHWGD